MAELHPRLAQDCVILGKFALSRLLLMKDANYPWFILVPDRDGITEIHQLTDADQQQLWRESAQLSRALEQVFNPDKLNIAALGNVVPQLHVHHVVRYQTDPGWPAPVWGAVQAVAYEDGKVDEIIQKLRSVLESGFVFS